MSDESTQETWQQIAERASRETDRQKLIELTQELIRTLSEAQERERQKDHRAVRLRIGSH